MKMVNKHTIKHCSQKLTKTRIVKHYIPIPVFDTFDTTISQYKTIYIADNPRSFINQWLNHCFANSE